MPAGTFQATWTTDAKAMLAAATAGTGPVPSTFFAYFKVGLGGRLPDGSVRVPDPDLTDLDILENPLNYPQYPNPPYNIPSYGSAILTPLTGSTGSITIPTPGTVRLTCVLDGATYNSSQTSTPTPPLICEVGIFDSNDLMLGYGTFGGVTKTAGLTLTLTVDLVF